MLDVATGAVLGVLGTALSSGHSDVGFAVPLRRAAAGPLADLLAENAATVPAYGADLNPAGVLALTATSVAQDGPPGASAGGGSGGAGGDRSPATGPAAGRYGGAEHGLGGGRDGCPDRAEPVERVEVTRRFAAFTASRASVLGLVGAPGTGRTTELTALTARRSRGTRPAPTLWLRGADLHADDRSLADAARRTLARAARIVAASDRSRPAGLGDITPERLARLARTAGRPLLLLLDSPEEMPPLLAHRLPEWTEGTAAWLRETGARLVVACRAEYWEHAGAEFPRELLYGTAPEERPSLPAAAWAPPGPGKATPPKAPDASRRRTVDTGRTRPPRADTAPPTDDPGTQARPPGQTPAAPRRPAADFRHGAGAPARHPGSADTVPGAGGAERVRPGGEGPWPAGWVGPVYGAGAPAPGPEVAGPGSGAGGAGGAEYAMPGEKGRGGRFAPGPPTDRRPPQGRTPTGWCPYRPGRRSTRPPDRGHGRRSPCGGRTEPPPPRAPPPAPRPVSGSVTWPTPRPVRRVRGTAYPTVPWRTGTPATPSPSACSRRCTPPSPAPRPRCPSTVTRSSRPTWT